MLHGKLYRNNWTVFLKIFLPAKQKRFIRSTTKIIMVNAFQISLLGVHGAQSINKIPTDKSEFLKKRSK